MQLNILPPHLLTRRGRHDTSVRRTVARSRADGRKYRFLACATTETKYMNVYGIRLQFKYKIMMPLSA